MNFSRYFLASLVGGLLGCAVTHAVQRAPAVAQGEGRFSECVSYRLDWDSDLEDLPANAKPIGGWTPVGGAGGDGARFVILCR